MGCNFENFLANIVQELGSLRNAVNISKTARKDMVHKN
jgi:hypothetical protein